MTIDIDVTDAWREATDPINDFGEEATAHLSWDDVTGCEVVAVSTDDGHGASRMNRDVAIQCMGGESINRIEAAYNAERGLFS